jgi:hypothetical protein
MALNLERFKNIPESTIYNFESPFLGPKVRKEASGG